MTKQPQKHFNSHQRKPSRPTHRVWLVQGQNDNAEWTEIGALWPAKNGAHVGPWRAPFNPLDGLTAGRIVVLPARFDDNRKIVDGAQ